MLDILPGHRANDNFSIGNLYAIIHPPERPRREFLQSSPEYLSVLGLIWQGKWKMIR